MTASIFFELLESYSWRGHFVCIVYFLRWMIASSTDFRLVQSPMVSIITKNDYLEVPSNL